MINMSVDYNNFAKTFSNSRKDMKWEEIDYFLSFLTSPQPSPLEEREFNVLDVGCGNGRFLSHLKKSPLIRGNLEGFNYLGIDLSIGLLNEAKKIHSKNNFLELNMLDIDIINEKFDNIFFIASFHHLDKIEDRLEVLKKAKKLLKPKGKIFMTNWSLNSELNKDKYKKSIISGSKNEFGSLDYNIKLGEFNRYYHSFDLKELEYLFLEVGFEIIENREFENKRNFVSIIRK